MKEKNMSFGINIFKLTLEYLEKKKAELEAEGREATIDAVIDDIKAHIKMYETFS